VQECAQVLTRSIHQLIQSKLNNVGLKSTEAYYNDHNSKSTYCIECRYIFTLEKMESIVNPCNTNKNES